MKTLKQLFTKYLYTRTFLGVILGMAGGFAYYFFIGCRSGSCPITSNPFSTILYGALLGGILFYKPKKKSNPNSETLQNGQESL